VIAVATTGGSEIMNIELIVAYTQWQHHLPVLLQEHIPFIRDTTTGCEVSTVTLQPATPITGFNFNTTPVTCNGGSDGTITATLPHQLRSNDNPVYTYTLNGTTVGG
jgi:hypothetical protein